MGPGPDEIAALYERYAPVVYHRALSITGNAEEAQDAVQETFSRVIRHWDAFRGESSPLTWMYRIATNWCLNAIRNRKGRDRKHEDHKHELAGDVVTWQKPGDEAERIRDLLADCDDETRRIVVHLYFDDMTKEQTAAMVGLSVPTVRKRLASFMERARDAFEVGAVAAGAFLALTFLPVWESWRLP